MSDPGRWFYCAGCGRPAVVFADGSCGHSQVAEVVGEPNATGCRMYSEAGAAEYAYLNRNAIACVVPPEFGGPKLIG